MKKTKWWLSRDTSTFYLLEEEQKLAQLTIRIDSFQQTAVINLGEHTYTIQQSGFWTTGVEIRDTEGELVLQAQPKKWYANSLTVSYKSKQYELLIWNNPLAEWSLQEADRPVLAYGLVADQGTGVVQITEGKDTVDVLLHVFLWYLFYPVVRENTVDECAFVRQEVD